MIVIFEDFDTSANPSEFCKQTEVCLNEILNSPAMEVLVQMILQGRKYKVDDEWDEEFFGEIDDCGFQFFNRYIL